MRQDEHVVFAVDDESDNLDLYRRALAPLRLRQFTDPKAALAAVIAEQPTGLILDYRMPDLDGLTLLKQARIAGYEGPALMVTAFAELDELLYAEQVNLLYRILPKPIVVERFRELVELLVHESRFRSNLEGRRGLPRFAIPLEVTVESNDKMTVKSAANVSLGGLLLDWPPQEPVPDELTLQIQIAAETHRVRGRVVHRGPAGIGIQFVEPSPAFLNGLGLLVTEERYPKSERRR